MGFVLSSIATAANFISMGLAVSWFTSTGPACITLYNDMEIYSISTMEDCKAQCIAHRETLPCKSLEFAPSRFRCTLAKENRNGPVNYEEVCGDPEKYYAEIIEVTNTTLQAPAGVCKNFIPVGGFRVKDGAILSEELTVGSV